MQDDTTPPPLLPPDLPKAAQPPQRQPQLGEQFMAKHPSVDGQWQVVAIVAHPTKPDSLLVQFPDTSRYEIGDIELGGPVNTNPTAEPAIAPGQTAVTSPLNPDYETFRKLLVEINTQSLRMFGMPLGPLTIMIGRHAVDRQSEGTGQMGNFAGVQMFVPNHATFDKWVEDYLYHVQSRESGRGAE